MARAERVAQSQNEVTYFQQVAARQDDGGQIARRVPQHRDIGAGIDSDHLSFEFGPATGQTDADLIGLFDAWLLVKMQASSETITLEPKPRARHSRGRVFRGN
ncbi:MAG: hypothetical protein RMN51_04935 [Verrucomicrobiota bacterium]|nr:hypothetical protein [Limisphaera sp.]MDW8381435.1 hypothetical protein [Verrucomicrobiota bacterium]